MSWFKPQSLLDKTYEVGIVLKGLDGLLEIAGALLLLVVSPTVINNVVVALTQHELSEDSRDVFANYLLHSGQHLATGGTSFAVAYLFVHGLTKVILVAALLRNKLWAYPASLAVLGIFIFYQIYTIVIDQSVGMTLLTLFDLLVVWLIWREYQQQKNV